MAFSGQLLVNGIDGESQVEGFDKHIDVLHYSMGVSNPPSMLGGGFSAGKATASDFSFSLAQGSSSTKLEEFCVSGKHIDTVTLKLSKSIGDPQTMQEYMTVTFTDCFISSAQEGAGGDVPIDSVSIAYSQKKVEYKEQKTSGGALTLAASYGWDFKKNAKAA
ncbi:MAG: type VI secretion system tube protein Hcp [Acidobacteriota bacterium]